MDSTINNYGLELGRFIIYLIYLYKDRKALNTLNSEENEPFLTNITNLGIDALLDFQDEVLDNQITPESQFNIDNFIIRTYINVLRTPINYTTLGTKFFKNPLLTYYIARNYNEDGTCRKSQR